MTIPKSSKDTPNPDLAGASGESHWVKGHNCVYREPSGEYRVSLRTKQGWKSYGHYSALGTADYVANVAILVEDCLETYSLNKIEHKDSTELVAWRSDPQNLKREQSARAKFAQLPKLIAAAEERAKAETMENIGHVFGARDRAMQLERLEEHELEVQRQLRRTAEAFTNSSIQLLATSMLERPAREILDMARKSEVDSIEFKAAKLAISELRQRKLARQRNADAT